MAYEGLFGIGDAGNLNNRDLVKESRDIQTHLQDVARFKEEQKRNEELRAKRRRENREDLYDQYYEGGEIHANYQPYIAGKVKGHHQWITENMDENGNIKDESLAEYRKREDQILQDVTALKDRTTDYNATVNDMRTEGTNINLYKKSKDGTYLIDFHEKAFLEGLKNGEINPNLPVDLPTMKGTPEPKRGSAEYIQKQKGKDGLLETRDERISIANNIQTTTGFYTDQRLDQIENEIYEQLNPNELYLPTGEVAKSTWIVDYMDQSNQTRFFEEESTMGIDSPRVLDPQDAAYDQRISDQYAKWLAKDLTKDLRKEEIIKQSYKKVDEDDDEDKSSSILTKDFVGKYNNPKPGSNSYNGFVAAEGTDVPVELKDFDSKLDISSKDIYVGPNNKQQEFTDPNGESITFEQLLEVSASKVGEDALFENAQLVKTMQLANGDFVGEYKLPGTNNTVLVSFDNMSSSPFKVVGNAKPSVHLQQFEYYKLQNQQNPPKENNASGFNKNKPGGTTTSSAQEVPKSDFEVDAYLGLKPPSTDGEIEIGGKPYSFENSLTEDNYDQLRKSGVRKVFWKSYNEVGERTPSLSSSGVLTIPYTKKMEGGKDFSPGTPFTMTDILQAIRKSK